MRRDLIGENLRRARQDLRLSQTVVAAEIKISRQAVSAAESGKRDITVRELVQLANLYRRSVQSLLTASATSPKQDVGRLERRRNAKAASDAPLDEHDTEEVAAFSSDLKKLNDAPAKREPVRGPDSLFGQLSTLADEIRLLADLRTPPISVYKALSCLGVRVRLTSLNTISGAFIPAGDTSPPGVLINSDQPSDRQRFSAAHELGHYVLRHAGMGATEIVSPLGRRFSPKEVEADRFASEFLMPTSLVGDELASPSVHERQNLETVVYRLADNFLVSYQAMVYRLANLTVITPTQKDRLLRIRPSDIEAQLQLKQRRRKSFDPASLRDICRSAFPDQLLFTIDGVRQLQELAFEQYAGEVAEVDRADTASGVYEKVALWVARAYPIPLETAAPR